MASVVTLMFLSILVGLGWVGARALAGLLRGDYVTIDVRHPRDDG